MSPNCLEPRLSHCFGWNGALKIGLVSWSAMAAVHLASESLKFVKLLLCFVNNFEDFDPKCTAAIADQQTKPIFDAPFKPKQ